MSKIRLNILNLSQSVTQNHSYAVILGEANGNRRLPVVIGAYEAQAIALILENVAVNRPMTHDLMKNIIISLGCELQEVVITNLSEGVFYAQLIIKQDDKIIEIDSRTSDAIALAIRFSCPVYTFETILEMGGITVDETEEANSKASSPASSSKSTRSKKDDVTLMNVDELEKLLQTALDKEDYEKAARIRDEISKRQSDES